MMVCSLNKLGHAQRKPSLGRRGDGPALVGRGGGRMLLCTVHTIVCIASIGRGGGGVRGLVVLL